MDAIEELKNNSKKFSRIVLWGFKTRWHTHRFIFQAYYYTLRQCDIPVVWVEDEDQSRGLIRSGDLIFTASGMHGKMVPEKKSLADYHVPIRDDVSYCLHAESEIFLQKINPEKAMQLKYYSDEAEQYPKWYEAVHFDPATKTLYQPWGTNLLPGKFKKPLFPRSRFVFLIGSVWNDKNNHGNLREIASLKKIVRRKNLRFIHIRFVPNFVNTILIRLSRLAPAIGGGRQVEINYLPDRMFKNISYGQLGFSNVRKFADIFKDCIVYDEDTEKMIDRVLSLNKNEYTGMIEKQQKICQKYTMVNHLNNIFRCF